MSQLSQVSVDGWYVEPHTVFRVFHHTHRRYLGRMGYIATTTRSHAKYEGEISRHARHIARINNRFVPLDLRRSVEMPQGARGWTIGSRGERQGKYLSGGIFRKFGI